LVPQFVSLQLNEWLANKGKITVEPANLKLQNQKNNVHYKQERQTVSRLKKINVVISKKR